jgi:aminoglycoside 6'-N-acetyltransferase I
LAIEIRMLGPGDTAALDRVAEGVFDHTINSSLTREFLVDPRHHLCVAIEDGVVIGFASAVHYVHPDKPTELWINEVAVGPARQRRGAAKAILAELLAFGRRLGCREAWVLTDDDNAPARALYKSAGGEEKTGVVMVTFRLDD